MLFRSEAFGLDPTSLPPIHRAMSKYLLLGEAIQRAPRPMPLAALYLLQSSSGGEPSSPQEAIAPIASEKEAARHLRAQAFMPRFVRGMGQEGSTFLATARLQQRVPLATLPVPRGIDRLQRWLEAGDLLQEAALAKTRGTEGIVGET